MTKHKKRQDHQTQGRRRTRDLLARIWRTDRRDPIFQGSSIGERLVATLLLLGVTVTVRELCARFEQYRVVATECYHLLVLVVFILLSCFGTSVPPWFVTVVAAYVVFELSAWSLFDVFLESRLRDFQGRRTTFRAFGWAVYAYGMVAWSYALFFLACGEITNADGRKLPHIASAVYFSITTITTVGYGDYSPATDAWLVQLVTVSEPIVGLVLLIVYVPVLISSISVEFRDSLPK